MRFLHHVLVIATLGGAVVGFSACQDKSIGLFKGDEQADSISGNYLSAHFAQLQKQPKEAAQYYEAALKKDPNNLELLEKGYTLYLEAGDVGRAIGLAETYIQQGGQGSLASLLVAIKAFKQKEYDAALLHLSPQEGQDITSENAISAATSDWVTPLLRAWAMVGKEQYVEAIAVLESQSQTRLSSFVQYQLALVHDLAGNTQEAKNLFKEVLKDAGLSLRLTEVAANFYMRRNEPEIAREVANDFTERSGAISADTFLKADAPSIQTAQHGAAELMLEVASFLYANRLDDMALEYVHMSLHLRPDFPHGKLLLANLMRAQNRLQESVDVLETITYPPYFSWQAQLSIARIYQDMERFEEAETMLKSLAKKETGRNREAMLVLGDIYMDNKNYDKAIEIYGQVIDMPREREPADWAVFYARGIAYERTEQWQRAEKDFFMALELKKNQPDVLNYLGYSWLLLGKNIDQAKEMLKTAITLRPTDAHIIDSYGWALYKLEQYEEAERYLERATLLLPSDPTTNDHLGDVYWKLGRTTEARFQWQRALTFNPKEEDKKVIEAKLLHGLDALPLASAGTDGPEEENGAVR